MIARLASTRAGRALGLAVGLAAALLALAPGELAPAAGRAAVVALLLAVAALLARRPARGGAPAPVAILARQPLAAGTGLALVEAGGRRLLVGFGRDGVSLVAELGATPPEVPGAGGGGRP